MIVEHYLTAYPAVYGQFPQAIPQPIAAVPAQREGKPNQTLKNTQQKNNGEKKNQFPRLVVEKNLFFCLFFNLTRQKKSVTREKHEKIVLSLINYSVFECFFDIA
jgi:hypothetical protein